MKANEDKKGKMQLGSINPVKPSLFNYYLKLNLNILLSKDTLFKDFKFFMDSVTPDLHSWGKLKCWTRQIKEY